MWKRGARGRSHAVFPGIGMALAVAGATAVPIAMETRIARSVQPLTGAWKDLPVGPRGATHLGISFRPFQVEAFGLDARATLQTLLAYPFQLIRLGAYWSRIEPRAGEFDTRELDWQIEAAERARKQVILAVGAVKTSAIPSSSSQGIGSRSHCGKVRWCGQQPMQPCSWVQRSSSRAL